MKLAFYIIKAVVFAFIAITVSFVVTLPFLDSNPYI